MKDANLPTQKTAAKSPSDGDGRHHQLGERALVAVHVALRQPLRDLPQPHLPRVHLVQQHRRLLLRELLLALRSVELLRRGSPACLDERLRLVNALAAPAAPLQHILQGCASRGPLAVGQREPRGVPRLLVPARVGVHLRQVPVRPAPTLERGLVQVARDQSALLVALVEVPARQLFHDVRELAHAEGDVHGEFLAEGVKGAGLVKRRADRARRLRNFGGFSIRSLLLDDRLVDVIPARLGEEVEGEAVGGDGDHLDGVVSRGGDHQRDRGVVRAPGERDAQRMDPATIVRRDEGGALRAEDRGEGAELGGRGDARGVADVLGVRDAGGEVDVRGGGRVRRLTHGGAVADADAAVG
mmetsp:Transcript_4880/g.20087  ORF Transcript_4880/g.20087 Transcript_4880/m.20087 type:complete len:356 (-) Transcript_4880:196-1263(-)